jgi:CAP N-terminal conserved motif
MALTCRLEAATSRLEDLAVANTADFREQHRESMASSASKDATPVLNTGIFSPDVRTSTVELPVEEVSPVLKDYQALVRDFVTPWVAKSEKIDPVVGEQVSCQPLLPPIDIGHRCAATIPNPANLPRHRPQISETQYPAGPPPS